MSAPCKSCVPQLVCSDPDSLFSYDLSTAKVFTTKGCDCKTIVPCGDLAVGLDPSGVVYFYPTQGFSFVINCPAGYTCGQPDIIKHIKKEDIPPIPIPVPIPTQGWYIKIKGCLKWIIRYVAPGTTAHDLQLIILAVQQEYAHQLALCQDGNPPIPTPGYIIDFSDLSAKSWCYDPSGSVEAFADFSVTTNAPSVTFSISNGTLPTGWTLNQTGPTSGQIRGYPNTPGTYAFDIQAKYKSTVMYRSYSITIPCDSPCPCFSNPPILPDASSTVGEPYSFQLTPLLPGTHTFSITSGALPGGLSLDPGTGLISGQATTDGTYSFTVTMTGGACPTCSQDFSIKVKCFGSVPDFLPHFFEHTYVGPGPEYFDSGYIPIIQRTGAFNYIYKVDHYIGSSCSDSFWGAVIDLYDSNLNYLQRIATGVSVTGGPFPGSHPPCTPVSGDDSDYSSYPLFSCRKYFIRYQFYQSGNNWGNCPMYTSTALSWLY